MLNSSRSLQSQVRISKNHGFTLVELVVVITIVGILAGGVALFIGRPTQSFFDTERRADLSDRADTALRRIARDIRNALPNSVRITTSGTDSLLEFTPVINAGRYRAEVGTSLADNPLDFSNPADTSFNVLGSAMSVSSNDSLVIYNLGIAGADVYESSNRRALNSATNSNTLSFTGSSFPLTSPSSRFYVVSTPVTYACDMTNRVLWRYQGYAFQATQPASIVVLDGLPSIQRHQLANNLASCQITYTSGILQRSGIVSINISMIEDSAQITLMHQINVANSP
ncbi:MAG: type II secretion system protein [Methylotenera sp.]|uniref:type II secretion system protein n=1 Tax=Methylotenera sp. TaxID=2051956 RepID=UPI0027232878|nr:type II secretion system protein [Methylotenera sp.]MDO9150389.1 type II secretion system protein [Methylotenera sp.]